MNTAGHDKKIPKTRIVVATMVFVAGFFSPILIPLVISSNLNTAIKSTLSGLLAFGIPELAILIAIAIAGKEGFSLIKQKFSKIITKISPDEVSRGRYLFGLILFSIPILFGFLFTYITPLFEYFTSHRMMLNIILDVMFVSSIFILGGNFWDKLRSLFVYDSKVVFIK